MDTIKVACGIIYKGSQVFLARRKLGKNLAGFWEFPGGKVEQGESAEQCLIRELAEELNMRVSNVEPYITTSHDYKDFSLELIAFKCDFAGADIELNDHDKYEWLDISRLREYELAPADIPIADRLTESSI